MSKNFHQLPRMSQASHTSLKWIIKRCYGMLSQGGCHLCQLLSASCTAGLLLAPTSSLKEKNEQEGEEVRCCCIPAPKRKQSCCLCVVHIFYTTVLKLDRSYATVSELHSVMVSLHSKHQNGKIYKRGSHSDKMNHICIQMVQLL